MNVSVTYDASANSAPAAFKSAVNYVVSLFDATFTNNVTVSINVGWGTIAGVALSAGALGESETLNNLSYSYDAVRFALRATALSSKATTQFAAANSLPTAAPDGAGIVIGAAQARALGLQAGGGTSLDGYVGFDRTATWSYVPGAAPSYYAYDLVGTIEHEFTEVMGRYGDVSASFRTLMDLFRYTAPGNRDLTTGGQNSTAYFSVDNGATNLGTWNNDPNNGDLGDWFPKGPTANGRDSFNDYSAPGGLNVLSPSDLMLMSALGWSNGPVSNPVVSISGAGGSTNVTDHRISGTIDGADASAAITFYDNSVATGGPLTAAADGTFATTISFLHDGVHTITAIATSPFGVTATSNSLGITLDSSANASLFAPLTPNVSSVGGDIYALYDALLGRAPDTAGFTA